jgi:hypothetical protein
MVLKGPALIRSVYPSPSLRPYNDLDLVVRPTDEEAVTASVIANGFTEVPDEIEIAEAARLRHVQEYTGYQRRFATPGGYIHLDLHLEPLQLGLEPVDEMGRWQRSLPAPGLLGMRMLVAEDQIVQLCVHALKHGYSRLIWLKDMDLLLRAERNRLDWALVESIAHREGLSGAVWYTLHLLTLLLDSPVPESVLRGLRPSLLIQALYQRIWPVDRVRAMQGRMHRRAVQFRPADAWRGSIPSLLLMGRRRARTRVALRAGLARLAWRKALVSPEHRTRVLQDGRLAAGHRE